MKKNSVVIIGLIVVVTLTLFFYGIYFLKGKNLLSKDLIIYARYQKVNGLYGSDAIMINGFKVGQVTDVHFAPDNSGDLIVEMLIQADIDIPKNSIAKISSLDLMGTKGVDIIFDKENTKICESGDTLLPALETTIKDEIEVHVLPIKEKAIALISSLDSVISVLQIVFDQEMQQNIKYSVSGINGTIANLERTSSELDALVKGEKNNISKVISNFSEFSDTLKNVNITQTVADANKAIADINGIVAKINEGDGTINQLLTNDTLYNNIEKATYNLDLLIKDINENPKSYVHFSLIDLGKKKEKKKKK